jgi:hypothetical protein
MTEKAPSPEVPRHPTEGDVLRKFESLTERQSFEELRKCEDEQGLYLWDIKLTNTDEDGTSTEYSYMREGTYAEGSAARTAIHVTFFDVEGVPVGGHSVAVYENGVWTM